LRRDSILNGKIYWIISELWFRILRKFSTLGNKERYLTEGLHSSDSEATQYLKSITAILRREKSLSRFRRKMAYREILEHLSYGDGLKYLKRIEELTSRDEALRLVHANLVNDAFGQPITFQYPIYGRVSATTLRYISTALEISQSTHILPTTSVVEIGCGYGGQASVINRTFGVSNYTCFDLEPVLNLIEIFLEKTNSELEVKFGTFAESLPYWDLAISNYAFSELSRELQIEYLEKVLSRSKAGYMIMNSGRTNLTGRSRGKLGIQEIREYLPGLKIHEEIPLTGPDNYVISWGNN
jgi:putative sugar O-methyltransferase